MKLFSDVRIRCTERCGVVISRSHADWMTPKRELWSRRVLDWRASGLDAEAFAARHELVAGTLKWWAGQLKRELEKRSPTVRLARVVTPTTSSRIEIAVGQARVQVEGSVDVSALRAVLEALGHR